MSPLAQLVSWLALAVVGLVFLVGYLLRRLEAARAGFFAQLDRLGPTGAGARRLLTFGGRPIRVEHRDSFLSLTMGISASGSFLIEKRGAVDGFLERAGLQGKIATNDARFDSFFHIISDDADFAAACFASMKRREAVWALFGEGCSRVELGEKGLQAVWTPFQIDGDTSAEFVKRSLPLLAVLGDELP